MNGWLLDANVVSELHKTLFIAATAQVHALTVCTRNENDFRAADVPVLNPWSE
ncbi:MAG: hypothetical protein OXG04_07170 [Acidobacteria bacterium]|nr:hypothetical protein [Acidobacteriota bacterium]